MNNCKIYQNQQRIESWMGSNRLKPNADKTQVIWVGTRQQLDKIHITELQLQSANVPFAKTVSDLGVVVDSQLNMSAHVSAVSRSWFISVASIHDCQTFPLYECCEDAGVHQQSTRLLQQPTSRCNEWPVYEASVRSECRRLIRHDVPEIRPYHARPP